MIEIEEKTVRVPKIHTTTNHRTHQHQIQTIEVEKPKIIHKTIQRKRPIVHDNLVHVPQEVHQVSIVDEIVDVPVVQQVHVPMVQKVQRHVEVPQVEFVDNHVHIPVHKHRHVPMVTVAQRHVEVPQVEFIDKVVHVPQVAQRQVPMVQTVQK